MVSELAAGALGAILGAFFKRCPTCPSAGQFPECVRLCPDTPVFSLDSKLDRIIELLEASAGAKPGQFPSQISVFGMQEQLKILTTITSLLAPLNPIYVNQFTIGTSVSSLEDLMGRERADILKTKSIQLQIIKANADNTDKVCYGHEPGVTTSTGFELSSKEALVLPLWDISNVYFVAGADSQKISYAALAKVPLEAPEIPI